MGMTNNGNRGTLRFFVTYTGVKLPFKLVNELQANEVENRNTFFRGYFDEQDRLTGFDKLAYSEVELTHRYEYHDNGKLKQVEIADIDGEVTVLSYDPEGNQLSA
jgi:YD repeat-containing protein